MLRKYKVNDYGQDFLNSRHLVKKKFLMNKVITEQSGVYYSVKGDPINGVALRVNYTSIPRWIKVTDDGMIYANLYEEDSRDKYYLPVTYNKEFADKIFSTYKPGEVAYCKDNSLNVKGTPNLLSVLVYDNVDYQRLLLDKLLDYWWDIIRWLELFEGTYRVWR